MNEKLEWTQQLGEAVINQQSDVLRAVQDMRQRARGYGYLKSTQQQIVQQTQEIIEILPTDPQIIYVPIYDPQIVYYAPAVDVVGSVIQFSLGFPLGAWLVTGCYWPSYSIVYGGFYWDDDGYHGDYNHHHDGHSDYPVTQINRTTNIYNTNTVYNSNTQVTQNNFRTWTHDFKHGNPFEGHDWHQSADKNFPQPSIKPGIPQQPDHSDHVREVQNNNYQHFERGMSNPQQPDHPDHVREVQNNNYQHFERGMSNSQQPDHSDHVREVQNNNYQHFERGMKPGQDQRYDVHQAPPRSAQNNSIQSIQMNRHISQDNKITVPSGSHPEPLIVATGDHHGQSHSKPEFRQGNNSKEKPHTSPYSSSNNSEFAINKDNH
jgi:uncharacterized protein DUF3300